MQGVAITQEKSLLDNTARIEGWLARFPMFDWVGGRTSEMSAVGLLPAALQACLCIFIIIDEFRGVEILIYSLFLFRELT